MAARQKKIDGAQARLFFLLIVFITSFMVIAVKLVYVQAVQTEEYSERAIGQRMREVELNSERGNIYDRNGQELAINMDAGSVYTVPSVMTKERIPNAAFKVAAIIGKKPSEVEAIFRTRSSFEYIARQLDMESVNEIMDLNIKGIAFVKERKRYYPGGALAAHVLGFAGIDNQGLSGVESTYEKMLKGAPGKLLVEDDAMSKRIPGGVYSKTEPKQGKTIYLTIDKDIQYKAEAELKKVVSDYSAKGGSIIVMNPQTGAILALASEPGFNLNSFGDSTDTQLLNRAIGAVYEPGSTAKIITASAALEEDCVSMGEVFSLPAEITIAEQQFGEYDGIGKGEQTVAGIVSLSSNVGTIELAQRLGKKKIFDYMTRFGLGGYSGIDLPGEECGVLPNPDDWSESSIATIPYGQGVSGTTLQMLNAVAAIANDGVKPEPHVMQEILAIDGGKNREYKVKTERVISKATAGEMQAIMVETVEKGTGKNARIPGYEIGGKTGTAQKAGENGYEQGKLIVTFAGFVSNLDPQMVIIVSVDEPQATGPQPLYAATIAAPVFRDIAEFCIKRLKLAPGSRERQ